jgi:hypothetical protein
MLRWLKSRSTESRLSCRIRSAYCVHKLIADWDPTYSQKVLYVEAAAEVFSFFCVCILSRFLDAGGTWMLPVHFPRTQEADEIVSPRKEVDFDDPLISLVSDFCKSEIQTNVQNARTVFHPLEQNIFPSP